MCRKRNVLSYLGFPNLDPTYYKYGIHTSWRKGIEGTKHNYFGFDLFILRI